MPDIGATLREARMRARIDITEVEDATKIRAKYLRALENEEWNLLPGSTFVKSFLREYAAYLGLGGRALVEEYKHRYEDPSEHELMPISPNLGRDRRGGGGGAGPLLPRWAVTTILAVLAVGLLLGLIGSLGGGGDKGSKQTSKPATRAQTSTPQTTTTVTTAPKRASLRLVPTGTIYVCLVDQNGNVLIPGTQFTAGQQVPVYRARSMRVTLGNNQVQMRVNGRPVTVPASSTAIAYTLTPHGASALPVDQAPTCT